MISLFFILDYILTYIGIQAGIIYEVNPFMVWVLELPFKHGLSIVVIFSMIFYKCLCEVKSHRQYNKLIGFIHIRNTFILILHLLWVGEFIRWVY